MVSISLLTSSLLPRGVGPRKCLFSRRELSQVSESFDFMLMRLLLQHLDDVANFLDQLALVSRPGKSALIIDAHNPVRFFHPDLAQFIRFFTAYSDCE